MSVGDMVTAPLAVASSETSSCPSPLAFSATPLASTLFLLEERDEEDPVSLDTVTRADGLGDSFSLKQASQSPGYGSAQQGPPMVNPTGRSTTQPNAPCGAGRHTGGTALRYAHTIIRVCAVVPVYQGAGL